MRTIYFKYLLVDSPDPSRIFNSCILYEKGGKNKYLIPIENSPENKEKKPPIHNYNLQEYIDDRLFGILRWIKDDDIHNFFDFHYENFKGKKYLFINKVEQLLNDKKRINSYLMKPENTINIIKYWIKEKKKELNKPKQQIQNESKQKLTLAEKCLLISLLQENNLFPKRGVYQTDTQIYNFISGILDIDPKDIKKGFEKARLILNNRKCSTGQINSKIKNLKNVEDYAKKLENDKINERLDGLKKQYQKK